MITGALFKGAKFGLIDIGVPPMEAVTDGSANNGELARHGVIMPTKVNNIGDSQIARHGVVMLNPAFIGSIRAVRHTLNMVNPTYFSTQEVVQSLIVKETFNQLDYTTENVAGTRDMLVEFTYEKSGFDDLEYSVNQGPWVSAGITSLPATFTVPDSVYQNISFRLVNDGLTSGKDTGKASLFMKTVATKARTYNTTNDTDSFVPVAGKTYLIQTATRQYATNNQTTVLSVKNTGADEATRVTLADVSTGNAQNVSSTQLKSMLAIWKAPDATPVQFRTVQSYFVYNSDIFVYELDHDYTVAGAAASTVNVTGNTTLETVITPQEPDSLILNVLVLLNLYLNLPIESNLGFQNQESLSNLSTVQFVGGHDGLAPVYSTITDPRIKGGSVLLTLELKKEV
jgi:hypothetical protein